MTQQLRVRRGFRNSNDQQIIATAGAVITGLTNNQAFPTPPIEVAKVQEQLDQLVAAIADLPHGGAAATAHKNNKRDALVATLRKLTHYVEDASNNDPAVLLSSGFTAVSVSRTQSALPTPSITAIDNGNSSQLLVRVGAVRYARCYELRSAAIAADGAPGPWQPNAIFTNSRSMQVNGLNPGTKYAFQVRAVGGSAGFSDWSNPVTRMSM